MSPSKAETCDLSAHMFPSAVILLRVKPLTREAKVYLRKRLFTFDTFLYYFFIFKCYYFVLLFGTVTGTDVTIFVI